MTKIRTQAHSRRQDGCAEVTNVIAKLRSQVRRNFCRFGLLGVVAALCSFCGAQTAPQRSPGPAESLYLRLRSVGLDKTQIYAIREGSLDRASLHISLESGTIAFTESCDGHITGAFFHGEGEVLLIPPNNMERASLAFFTKAAILEERFTSAYFRFTDDAYSDLKPALRPLEDTDPAAFVSQWGTTAKNLAEEDALRLLMWLSNQPSAGLVSNGRGRLLHGFLEGEKLSAFDVRFDSALPEQISAGQHKTSKGVEYYDVWTSFSAPSFAGETSAAPPATPDFEITQFKIRSQIKPPTQLEATAVLTITPRHDGKKLLLFELSRLLQVKSALADGHPVEFIHNQAIEGSQLARRGDDALAVYLPDGLRTGHTIEVTIQYSGAVLSEAASGLLYVGEHGTWYPNVGFAMSSFDLEFRYPQGWTLIATGHEAETKPAGSEQVSHWVSESPVPVAGFNLGRYSRNVTRAGNVSVETYATSNVERGFPIPEKDIGPIPVPAKDGRLPLALPEPGAPSPSQNTQMVGATAARAVEFYQQRFGSFPYSELALTQFPGQVSQGWPGLVFLSSYAFLSPREREAVQSDPKQRLLMEQVIAHETAHQWWGDLVTWNGYRDQWTMEALANYSALLLLESRNPGEFHEILQKFRDDLLQKRDDLALFDAGPVTLGFRLSSSRLPTGYEVISYERGTWLLHMLRSMLRDSARAPAGQRKGAVDEPFVRALHRIRMDYEGKALTTQQLIAAFEPDLPHSLWYEGHKSLDWFYDSWVNGSAVPRLELRDLKFADKAAGTTISGTIVQDYAPDTLVTAVPLYASVGGRNVFLGRVFAEGPETSFHISAPHLTRKVLLDPERTLLSRN